ncbi:MAG: hypothetical protein GX607_11395 [Myxococcales bacterium]|nr:hypothetical protein [Myxococcales bacterium]
MSGFLLARRQILVGIAACAAPAIWTSPAEATIARALTTRQLVRASGRVVRGTPVERFSTWENVRGRRRIVTHTRVLVDEDLARPHDEREVLVLTWGGRVGDVAQLAHGEAALQVGEESVLFLTEERGGERRVTAMAQGHYPLERVGSDLVLRRSPQLPELVDRKDAAVDRLVARRLGDASRLIQEALR